MMLININQVTSEDKITYQH